MREEKMKIEVLGTGCPKCNRLEEMARTAADKLGAPYELEHVKEIGEIVKRGVMVTPALAIDGQIVVAGRLPTEGELASWLTSAMVG
jgi:small redox-active disulfide protein 2